MSGEVIKLLFVEDNRTDQIAFQRFARKENLPYEIAIAGSAGEALTALRSGKFDVIIADYMLGDGLAFDIISEAGETPTIVVTGTSDPEIAANIIKAGAYDYIIKDVEFGHLVKLPITVHNALLHSKHVQEIKRYQERLEELVKERTAELRLKDFAIESSLTPFLITSRDALIQYANKAFLETWGASAKEEVIGKKLDEFLKMECDLLAIVSEKGHLLGTGIGKRSDGPHINVEVAINVIRDLEGFPLALVVSLVDITERKRAEEALRESEAQLMQARKIESLGRLAGGVAHDFNNMLAAIIGSAEVLHSDLPQDSSLQSFVSMIMKASQHSRDLVKQLLAFARQQALILEIIDLNKVISGLEEILRRPRPD
jgi:PAS domain S-box-containing protein